MRTAGPGPASNLMLAVIASLVLRALPATTLEPTAEAALAPVILFLKIAVYLNVLLAVFNMVPVPPLDGGNVVAGLLRGPAAEAYDRLRPYGFVILYALMLTGMLARIVFPVADAVESWLL